MPFSRFRATLEKAGIPAGQRIQYIKGQGYKTVPVTATATRPAPSPLTVDARVNAILDSQFGKQTQYLDDKARQLTAEAAGRRQNYQDAYKAAALANAAMGADVQQGWSQAGTGISTLANALTGSVGDATRAGVATADAQLANIGAPATQYDPTSQQGVESYLGGYLPARQFAQLGGAGRQLMNEVGIGLNTKGLQESLAAEGKSVTDINKSLLDSYGAIATARPEAYRGLRGIFDTEGQNAIANRLANQEMQASIEESLRKNDQYYAGLLARAKTAQERAKYIKDRDDADRRIRAGALEIQRKKADAAIAKVPRTWQEKVSKVFADELDGVARNYRFVKPVLAPLPDRQNGANDTEYWKVRKANSILINAAQNRWQAYMFSMLWPRIGGSISQANALSAKTALRRLLFRASRNWDPMAPQSTASTGTGGLAGAVTDAATPPAGGGATVIH